MLIYGKTYFEEYFSVDIKPKSKVQIIENSIILIKLII